MNIIWVKPDASVAVTTLSDEGIAAAINQALEDGTITDAESAQIEALCLIEANRLVAAGNIPGDWNVAAVNISLPDSREWRGAWAWITPDPVIDIDLDRARELTKTRLRHERAPLLADLDINVAIAIERGIDTTPLIAEKQRLRDITALAAGCATLDDLRALSCATVSA